MLLLEPVIDLKPDLIWETGDEVLEVWHGYQRPGEFGPLAGWVNETHYPALRGQTVFTREPVQADFEKCGKP